MERKKKTRETVKEEKVRKRRGKEKQREKEIKNGRKKKFNNELFSYVLFHFLYY